ncbi:ATP-grasp fold amidoligase family protein [Salinicoccus roseus]|uniref:ATP-grasp fold amidoligase family protein n=1 Tax=Salinicoccus roseus TaxID=45670 RepID=UPI003561BC0F
MADEKYAKIKYKENTGKKLNINEPKTFNEKLWWLKLNNRDSLMTKCSDKLKVREYVADQGLKEILNPLIDSFKKPEEINFSKLPPKAFIKVNHSSGTNYLWDKDNSMKFNREAFNKKFNKALESNYYLQSREFNYKDIEPCIIIEDYISDDTSHGLLDFRFFCFNGKVKIIQVDIDVAGEDGSHNPGSRRNIYDADFNYLEEVRAKRENFDPNLVQKPKNFNLMKKYAEILSDPFPFCRVDLYNIKGNIIFGEMTFYPGGGTQIFDPYEWEVKLGDYIDLSSPKIIKNYRNH